MRSIIILTLLATGIAVAAPSQTAEFDATVVALGEPAQLHCGLIAANQPIIIDVTKVVQGSIKKDRTVLEVMTCGGALQRPASVAGFEIDPDQLRAGSRIHLTAEPWHRGEWATTTDHITVTKR